MYITMFDQKEGYIWYNSEFVPWKEAKLHVLSHGLHYATSVFEGIRSFNGKPFLLKEHFERLHNSAKYLGFGLSYSVAELCAATEELLKINQLSTTYIRPVAWRGSESMMVAALNAKVHVAIAAWETPDIFGEGSTARLIFGQYRRPTNLVFPMQAKAASLYAIGSLEKTRAMDSGYNDAVMLDQDGYVAECTSSNIFIVRDGKILTPYTTSCLDGLTRQTIINMLEAGGKIVTESQISVRDLLSSDEIFIVGTAIGVAAVTEIEGKEFAIGQLTKELQEKYLEKVLNLNEQFHLQ